MRCKHIRNNTSIVNYDAEILTFTYLSAREFVQSQASARCLSKYEGHTVVNTHPLQAVEDV